LHGSFSKRTNPQFADFRLESVRPTEHDAEVRDSSAVESPDALTHFVTTKWSLIRQRWSRDERSEVDPGLAQLCQIYWRPIFTFIYRRGYAAADAQDLTQDFFMMIMEGSFLESADPKRGRFRSLLLRSLKNFLIDESVKRRRHKRGGQVQFVSWEKWMGDAPAQLSLSPTAVAKAPPEAVFDAAWAASIAEEALRRLRVECESKGRRRVYSVLHPYLVSDRSEICYEKLSRELGVPELSVKSLLHHFRIRYRALLREEVAKTVESEANVDDEIRYLCATLSAEPH
jgi:DNA-directed RNA polymerase specialized sigma24 family protein